jgi:heme A synthase
MNNTVAGWWDGFHITMTTQLTISIIILLAAAVLATALYIARQPHNDDEETVEGHRVDWQ